MQQEKNKIDLGAHQDYSNLPVWEEKRILEAIQRSDTEKFRLLTA